MSYSFGVVIPRKYLQQTLTFCDNMGIKYQIWSENEVNFPTEEDQNRVAEWVKRLERLDK